MRHHRYATIDVDDIEVELDMDPDWLDEFEIVKPTPTTLVVGYLMPDSDCQNPLKDFDGEGTLYTYRKGVITDNDSAPSCLGLNSFTRSWRDDELDRDFGFAGIFERVAEKVTAQIKDDPELSAWMVSRVMEFETPMEKLVDDLVNDELEGSRFTAYDWSDEHDQEMIKRLDGYESLARDAWDELYAEGKIGDYLAVPVRYHDSVHGPGTTQIYTTSIDDCNAVWVPGEFEISNMDFTGCETYADKLAVADKYATGCLKQYESWCNGDCYGIVVETFVLNAEGDAYEKVGDTDSCWGFIGMEWATESLKEQMGYEIERLKAEKEAA